MKTMFQAFVMIAAASGLSLGAQADQVGSVESQTGELGSVIVNRGGSTFSLSAGEDLFDGDRVTVRSSGTARLTAYGCTKDLTAASTIVISADFCETAVSDLSATDAPVLAEVVEAGADGGSGLIVLGGLAGVAAVASASGGGGDDGDTPTSP